jgi:hypothetical protein
MDESEVLIIWGSVKGLAPAGRVERGRGGFIRNYQVRGQENILRRGATRRMSERELAAHPEFRGRGGRAAIEAYNTRQVARRNPVFNRPIGRGRVNETTGPTATAAIRAARRARGRAIRGR